MRAASQTPPVTRRRFPKIALVLLGLIAGLLAILLIASEIGFHVFRTQARDEARNSLSKVKRAGGNVVTEAELEGLPDPVQKYLRYTGIVGRERIQSARLKMKGKMRMSPGQGWIPLKAEEYYTTDPPSLVWFGNMRSFFILTASARDLYATGKGNMHIKLLSLFTIADARGADMDDAVMIRYLNEAVWHPTTFLRDYIQWEPIDALSAGVSMTVWGRTVTAICLFNDMGEMVDFVADRVHSGTNEIKEWHTPLDEYAVFQGIRVPCRGSALFKLDSGDFEYLDLEVSELEFNNEATY